MSICFIVLSMLFCHIVADYNLQGWLASAKQKSWWANNSPGKLYKYDYIMALAMHSFSWSFMIMLPIAAYYGFNIGETYCGLLILNSLAHAYIDDLKANKRKINLIADQLLHMAQIAITAAIML